MWARVIEFMLGCWLAISPYIFGYETEDRFFWISDYSSAFLIGLFALLSFYYPLRKIHLLSLGVAVWLMLISYQSFPAFATPLEQNAFSVGMLMLMLALVPSHSHLPPHSWQVFEKSIK